MLRPIFKLGYIVLSFLLLVGFGKDVYSEAVSYNNITVPAIIDGDRVLVGASIVVDSPGDLVINGDLTIFSGSIFMGPSAGQLRVFGDLFITSTDVGESASIIAHNNIEVSGGIFLRSSYGEARISTTGGDGGFVEAERIVTSGYLDSSINVSGDVTVVAEIDVKSESADAFVYANNGDLYAGSIATYAGMNGDVKAKTVTVMGQINTIGLLGDAGVNTTDGFLYAGAITTSAGNNASVFAIDNVEVRGAVRVTSTAGDACVVSDRGTLLAGAVVTDAVNNGYVMAAYGIEVRGDICTFGSAGDAFVSIDSVSVAEPFGLIMAVNIVTDGYVDSYVKAYDGIDVWKDISTRSENGTAYIYTLTEGDITAYSISTNSSSDSYVLASKGDIVIRGCMYTKSLFGEAYVEAINDNHGGFVSAESIFTNGYFDSSIRGGNGIDVKDIIDVKSSYGSAYVRGFGTGIKARSINTSALEDAFVYAAQGSVMVAGDIRTYSESGDAYVWSTEQNGNIEARSITTSAPTAYVDSIKSSAGFGKFQLQHRDADIALTIKNSEFNLDRDHVWNTQLSLEGTCTINGNGYLLNFESNGGILVKSGSSLLLKNITLDALQSVAIQCEDNTATLFLYNVTCALTNDMTFENGRLEIFGDVIINGWDSSFIFESSMPMLLHENSRLIFTDGVTFYYDADTTERLVMANGTSRLEFNNASLYANRGLRLTNGTLGIDNLVSFDVAPGQFIYFGDGVSAANNVLLDFYLGSQFDMHGNDQLVNDNV